MTKHTSFRGIVAARANLDPNAALAALNTAIAEARSKTDEALKGKADDVVVKEQLDRINATIGDMKSALDEVAIKAASANMAGKPGVSAEVEEYDREFKSWFRKGDRATKADLGSLAVKASLTTDNNPESGYVVSPQMDTEINRVLATVSGMRSVARVVSLSSNSFTRLHNMGGAGSGWVGEKDARTQTGTPDLRKLEFPTMELYAMPAATQTLLDDAAISIEQWLADEVSITFAEQEGAAFINGNGVNQPRGLLSYDKVANASYAWGKLGFTVTGGASGFAASAAGDALVNLYYSLKAGHRNGASWLISDGVMGSIATMKDGDGTYLFKAPNLPGEMGTLLGKPVLTDDNMDALEANKFPVAFGNFQRGYVIADRTGVRVLRDPYTTKPYVLFYTTKRVGGGVQDFEAIKLLKVAAS
jgi:HK97 family phage major capsid protein